MTSITDHNSLLQLTCIQKRRRSPKHTSAMYLALLLLCAGDIETNPGPITCKLIIQKHVHVHMMINVQASKPSIVWRLSRSFMSMLIVAEC